VTCAQPRLWHCRDGNAASKTMITLDERIARTERLLRRLQEDQPYLQFRLAPLGAEYRQSANDYANRVRAEAEAELRRLLQERTSPGARNPSDASAAPD